MSLPINTIKLGLIWTQTDEASMSLLRGSMLLHSLYSLATGDKLYEVLLEEKQCVFLYGLVPTLHILLLYLLVPLNNLYFEK